MSDHAYTAPACQWIGPRPTCPALAPGGQVTLCTAQRVWTVASINGTTATITCRDSWAADLTVHVAHLEHVDGQTELDLGDVA